MSGNDLNITWDKLLLSIWIILSGKVKYFVQLEKSQISILTVKKGFQIREIDDKFDLFAILAFHIYKVLVAISEMIRKVQF